MDHPKSRERKLRPGRAIKRVMEGLKTQPRPRFGMSFSLSGDVQRAQTLPNHAVYLARIAPDRGASLTLP